eukprot:123898-Rhodomonas_salina.2
MFTASLEQREGAGGGGGGGGGVLRPSRLPSMMGEEGEREDVIKRTPSRDIFGSVVELDPSSDKVGVSPDKAGTSPGKAGTSSDKVGTSSGELHLSALMPADAGRGESGKRG